MNEYNKNRTTDKGWIAMRDLLDRDMPTEPKRKRMLWWWLAFLVLPIVAYGGWYWWMSPAVPSRPALAHDAYAFHTLPVEKSTRKTPVSDKGLLQKRSHVEPALLPFAKSLDQKEKSKISMLVGDTRLQPLEHINSDIANPVLQAITLIDVDSIHQLIPVPATDIAILPIKLSDPGLNVLPVVPHSISIKNIFSPKPLFIIADSYSKNKKQLAKKSPVWQLGATASLSTELFTAINGFGGGVGVHWQPTRRWGVRSGIQYSQNAPTAAYQPVAVVQPTQYEQAVDSFFIIEDLIGNIVTPTTGDTSIQETVYIPIAKLKMVELPILISYQVLQRFRLFAGLNTTYLIAANAASKSYSGDLKLQANTSFAIQNLNTLAASDIRHWRFDAQTGIGIKLGQRLEMAFFAKLPLRAAATFETAQAETGGPTVNLNGEAKPDNKLNRRIPSFSMNATYFFGHSK